MINLKLKACLASVVLCLVGFSEAGTKIPANNTEYQAGLGDGWDLEQEALKGNCLTGKAVTQGISEAKLDFKQSISFEQLEKELGFGAAGRAKYGVISASASADFLSNSKTDSFSIVATYKGDYKFKNLSLIEPKVTPQMEGALQNDEKWEKACGHEYVQQLTLGAKIFFTIRIDFISEAEKKAFQAAFSIDGPMFGVSGNVHTAANSFSKRTNVTIAAYQIGGEIDKLSHTFGNSQNLVKCSFGDFDKCSDVLASALDYATQEFPKQIAPETLNGENGNGPVTISYLTKPWATAGIFEKTAALVKEEVKRARVKLEDYLAANYDVWIYARRFSQGGARRLSTRQAGLIEAVKTAVDWNTKRVAAAAQHCYDYPDLTCLDEVNRLGASGDLALKPLDRTAFVIENESFAQFCDDGLSPGPYAGSGLKTSITAFLDLAKKVRGEAFNPPQPGASIDECMIAGNVFLGQTEIKANGLKISDIRPLMEFVHLESLDLSDNQLTSLDAFELPFVKAKGGFKRLRNLNLHRNQLTDLKPLCTLPALAYLDLSNNLVLDAEPLSKMTTLLRVDLRNNSQDLVLKLPPPAVVLTADHGSSPLFVHLPKMLNVDRFAHQAVPLSGGRVLIAGGIYGGADVFGAEVFDAARGNFTAVPGMSAARSWHTLTQLQDGNVVAIGGLRRNTADLFNVVASSFQALRSLLEHPRAGHTATLLQDGRVLVTGGWRLSSFADTAISAEVFDPRTGDFRSLSTGLSVPRAGHTATLLADGRVLLAGGTNDEGSSNSADIYDPASDEIHSLGRRLQFARGLHTATLLPSGKVLLIGGIADQKAIATAEVFDPTTGKFAVMESQLKTPRLGHQATLFDSGVVAITGGSTEGEAITADRSCKHCTADVELYDPATNDFTLSNRSMVRPRVFHTVTRSGPNQYLVLGGLGPNASKTAEILSYSAPNR